MEYHNALDFISTVRAAFVNEPWVFDAFVVILSEYRKQLIDIDDLMSHMRAVFSSHEPLFDQFCGFLPGQATTLESPACSAPSAYCPSALDFVSYVKARCAATTPDVYHRFLALITAVDGGQLSVPEMYSQICTLFEEDSELLSEFKCFFQGEWASDESSELYRNMYEDAEDDIDDESTPSITSSPSLSVESLAGVETPADSGSPLPRSLNLKGLSMTAYEPREHDLSIAGQWNL